MKKFIGGAVFGFAAGVVATIVWAVKGSMKREDGRKRWAGFMRNISVHIDKAADRLEDSWEEKTAVDCCKCENPCSEPKFDLYDICGVLALFSDVRGELEEETERIVAETGKRDYFLYWLRDDGHGCSILTAESSPVHVNYYATILTKVPLNIPECKDVVDLHYEKWSWLDDEMTVREFLCCEPFAD